MKRIAIAAMLLATIMLTGCGEQDAPPPQPKEIMVRSEHQKQLFDLTDLNRAIALKRAILATGSECKRLTSSGFVGPYKNMDMWTARCQDSRAVDRDWAIFVGANDTVQVRLCKDTAAAGLPACTAQAGTEAGSGVAKKK